MVTIIKGVQGRGGLRGWEHGNYNKRSPRAGIRNELKVSDLRIE